MNDGKCLQKFPKPYQNWTHGNVNGRPLYHRPQRPPIHINNQPVNNRFVVPYNDKLLLMFDVHINVEICTSVKSVKYIYKCIYKGYDCADIITTDGLLAHDEIKHYVDARYVSAIEAMWRLLGYNMNDKLHTIIRLQVHTPDHQVVYFEDGNEHQALEQAALRNTTLTAWFQLNVDDVHAGQYLYTEIAQHFVYKKVGNINKWCRRH